jgi:hypothetical protein
MLCGLLIGGIVAAHIGSIGYPFLFDGLQLQQGLQRLEIDSPSQWLRLRPRLIGYLSFDLQYTLHGDWAPGFHAVNIAVHAAATVLLFLIARGAINRAVPAWSHTAAMAAAFFTASVWGLHPLQTHSVTYLYQRFESLMGMFFLASVWCLLRGAAAVPRQSGWLLGSFGCFLLSIATKEVAVVTPLVLLLFDRAYLVDSWQEVFRRRWAYYSGMAAVMGAGFGYVLSNYDHYVAGGLLCVNRVSVWQYLRTQPEVVLHYLVQSLWPARLSIDPAWPVQDDPVVLMMTWCGVVMTAGVVCWLWWSDPRIGFLPLWFGLILLPTSSVAPVIDLAFEHRMYLPLAAVAASVVAAGVAWLPRRFAMVVGCVVVIGLGVATGRRNAVHASPLALWADAAEKAPHNTRALANAGTALLLAGRAGPAEAVFEEIVQLYQAAASEHRNRVADAARRTPRTMEYVWYAFDRLANHALERGDLERARMAYTAITRLPTLPKGGLGHPSIRRLRERLEAEEMPAEDREGS